MRFSAVQEDGYGVGLGQEDVPNNNVDNSMMTATGGAVTEGENTVDECSIAYNLPLLFANGYPSSLENITLPELERFITFMVVCSFGGPTASILNRRPPWWPQEIQYSIPFVRPPQVNNNFLGNLKKLVFRCYTYHKSEYLLRFCSYLAQYPKEKLYYVNNWDSTTSLYHRSTGKLLATFRNENMEYDKIAESPRRSLLPPNGSTSSLANKKKKTKTKQRRRDDSSSLVIIQPQLQEIYLCDNCDAEFEKLDQMKDHEKICGGPVQNEVNSRPSTPCDIVTEVDQNKFLDYFKLLGINETPKSSSAIIKSVPVVVPCVTESRRSSRRRAVVDLARFPTIPFSSPAGLAMIKESSTISDEIKQKRIDLMEQHIIAPPLTRVSRPKWMDRLTEYNRWGVTYKPNREKSHNYTHSYTFGAFKRKLVLNIRSQILFVTCQKLYVHLEKTTIEQLKDLKQQPWKYSKPLLKYTPKHRQNIIKKICHPSIQGIKRQKAINSPAPSSIQKKRMKINNNNNNNNNLILKYLKKNEPCERRSEPPQTIVLVDLCSSDDDNNDDDDTPEIILTPSDENCDPRCADNNTKQNFFRNNTLQTTNNNKFRSKSLGSFTSKPVNDWLCDNPLTEDSDKCMTNVKCLGNAIDSSNTLSSIIQKTPSK